MARHAVEWAALLQAPREHQKPEQVVLVFARRLRVPRDHRGARLVVADIPVHLELDLREPVQLVLVELVIADDVLPPLQVVHQAQRRVDLVRVVRVRCPQGLHRVGHPLGGNIQLAVAHQLVQLPIAHAKAVPVLLQNAARRGREQRLLAIGADRLALGRAQGHQGISRHAGAALVAARLAARRPARHRLQVPVHRLHRQPEELARLPHHGRARSMLGLVQAPGKLAHIVAGFGGKCRHICAHLMRLHLQPHPPQQGPASGTGEPRPGHHQNAPQTHAAPRPPVRPGG